MQTTDHAVPNAPVDRVPVPSRLSELLNALQAVQNGDFSVRLPGDWIDLEGKVAATEVTRALAAVAKGDPR